MMVLRTNASALVVAHSQPTIRPAYASIANAVYTNDPDASAT
jgi:hypothetical protein